MTTEIWTETEYVERQSSKHQELNTQLEQIEQSNLVGIKPQVEEFLETFFSGCEKRKLCAHVEARERFISVIFHEEGLYCEFNFMGDGVWGQSLNHEGQDGSGNLEHIRIDIVGKAHMFTTQREGEEEKTHYFFYPNDTIQRVLSLSPQWQHEYHPRLKEWEAIVKWETNRYDGPLSGYCEIGRRLYYFDCVEEREFDRARMYAAYPLSPLQEITLRWGRFVYETFIQRFNFMYQFYWWSKPGRMWWKLIWPFRKKKYEQHKNCDVFGYFSRGDR